MQSLSAYRASSRWSWEFSALASGPVTRLWAYTAMMSMPVKRRIAPQTAIPLRLRLAGLDRWFWFTDPNELIALEEIFVDGEYAGVDYQDDPTTIVDLGANIGQAALWYRSRFPAAQILCVEPDPHTFSTLRRNLCNDPLVTLRHAAITAEDGLISILRAPLDGSWATRVVNAGPADLEQVAGLTLRTLLDEHNLTTVDILKVDIEGVEHQALGHSAALECAQLVIGEIHASLLDLPADAAIEDMRMSGGFKSCELDGDIFVLKR